jgi:hypothetical protein
MEDIQGPDGLMGFKNCCPNDERKERPCLTNSLGESWSGILRRFSSAPRENLYVGHRVSAYLAKFYLCLPILLTGTHRADALIDIDMGK